MIHFYNNSKISKSKFNDAYKYCFFLLLLIKNNVYL